MLCWSQSFATGFNLGVLTSLGGLVVLNEMRSLVRKVEEADSHPWKEELADLPMI